MLKIARKQRLPFQRYSDLKINHYYSFYKCMYIASGHFLGNCPIYFSPKSRYLVSLIYEAKEKFFVQRHLYILLSPPPPWCTTTSLPPPPPTIPLDLYSILLYSMIKTSNKVHYSSSFKILSVPILPYSYSKAYQLSMQWTD